MAKKPSTSGNPPSALAAIPPPVNAERTQLTDHRVRTASDVQAAYSAMHTADLERARERALCQSAVDGAAPYSDAKSRAMGQYGRSNFNPGFAARSTFKEQAPYIELLEQMDIFTTVPTKHGDQNLRGLWEPILAEGFTKMLKRWPMFNYLWLFNVNLFVRDGVSMTCFEDENDWQWNVYGMQHFKFPEGSKPCEDYLDMCGWKGRMNCRQLYRKIQNEKVAKKAGWNVKAVKDAIKKAAAITYSTDFDWEALEKRWKANEVLDGARAPQVETINLLVQELDGTITHLIGPKSGEGPLFYEKRNMFRSMRRFMTIFSYGVGTNGDLHSIRGHTSRIFNTVVSATRTLNAFVDLANFAATPHLEAANDDALTSLPMRKVGWLTMVQQGNKFLDTQVPDFGDNLLPLYNLMSGLFEGESSGQSVSAVNIRGMERKTDRQEQNERLSEGQLTTAAMSLFFPSLERHFQEVMRRVKRKDYRQDEPGGELVWWFRNYLQQNGVPLEALYDVDVDSMEVNTGIGRGSQLARMAVADSVMEDYDLYDEQGKNTALRLRLQTRAGSRIANQIAPLTPNQRPGQQVDNADDQNGFLCSGNPAQVMSVKIRPDQNSEAHVQTHLEFLRQLWPMTTQQDQRAALTAIQPVWAHCIDDLELVSKRNPLFKAAKQELREMSEWIVNTAKELAAEEDRVRDKAMQEGTAPNGQAQGQGKDVGGEGPNMSNFARAIDARAKLQYTVASDAEKLRHQKSMNALKEAAQTQTLNFKALEMRLKTLQGSLAA